MVHQRSHFNGGCLIFMVLVGMQSISYVSLRNKPVWVPPEDVVLEPGPALLVTSPKSSKEECNDVPVSECYDKLQTFLKMESLQFTSDKSKLDSLCNMVESGYNCSVTKSNIPFCLSPTDKSLMPIFVDMAQYTMFMFCPTGNGPVGYLREDLLQNSDCILQQKEALDCCVKQSKVPDIPVLEFIEDSEKSMGDRQIAACCPVSYFIKCVQTVIEKSCGKLAGNLTTEYIRRASGSEMEAVCQKMTNYPDLEQNQCNDVPAPVCSGHRIGTFMELMAFMSLLYIMYISHV